MAKRKRIRRLNVRVTTTDEDLIRKLCRAIGCTPSVLTRDLIHAEARRRGIIPTPLTAAELAATAEPLL
jgi:hypothetical protein